MITIKYKTDTPPKAIEGFLSVTATANLGESEYTVAITVQEDDESYRYRKLMERPEMSLKFSLPQYVDIPVGAWVEFQGETYYLRQPSDLTRNGERKLDISMTLGTLESGVDDYKLVNPIDRRLKFSYCAKPWEFAKLIADNMNERDGEGAWTYDEAMCLDSTEKTVEFNHNSVGEALVSIADAFETEFEITKNTKGQFVVCFRKVEYNKAYPVKLAYGKGNGFIPGVGRSSESDERPIKRLYIEGSDRNIVRDEYGGLDSNGNWKNEFHYTESSSTLLLPPSQTLSYDGEHFEDDVDEDTGESVFNQTKARTYKSDKYGYYIERYDTDVDAVKEDSLDCTEIYPSYEGEVTSAFNGYDSTDDNETWDIRDTNIPSELDFSEYQIDGEKMTVIFQSGMLAGKEFDVNYYHEETASGRLNRRFEIIPTEYDGVTMPCESGGWIPLKGDKYAVFNIMLPKSYICDDASKTGASWKMFREAVKYLYEHETQKFTFTGELQALWAKRHWESIGTRLVVGGYVKFTDKEFAPDGTDIRIVGVKDYLKSPYSPQIELSNTVESPTTASSAIKTIPNIEVQIEDGDKQMKYYTRRRWRDAKETITALENALLENFTESISPIAVQTMSTLVGDESLQFSLLAQDSNGDMAENAITIEDFHADGNGLGCLTIPACYLRHETLDVNAITSDKDAAATATADSDTCKVNARQSWKMAEAQLTPTDTDLRYVYAKCHTNHENGEDQFVMLKRAHPMFGETDHTTQDASDALINADETEYYYFLVGILNSEYDGARSFASLYGYTEILPGRITTPLIVSNNGKAYINLETGEMGGTFHFLSDNNTWETLIDGGSLNTKLLEAYQLIANRVIVKADDDIDGIKQRVEIIPDEDSPAPNSVAIYDDNNKLSTILEGKAYSGISELYSENSASDGNTTPTVTESGEAINQTWFNTILDPTTHEIATSGQYSSTTYLTDLWHTSTLTAIELSGAIYLEAYTPEYDVTTSAQENEDGKLEVVRNNGEYMASAAFVLWLDTYEDAEATILLESKKIDTKSVLAPGGNIKDHYDEDLRSDLLRLTAAHNTQIVGGYHRLRLECTLHLGGSRSRGKITWVDLAVTSTPDVYISRYFANGLCLGARKDNYVMILRDTTTSNMALQAEMTSGIGFKVDTDGVQARVLGNRFTGRWMPMPILLFADTIAVSSDGSLTYGSDSISMFTDSPVVSLSSTGKVQITIPAIFRSYLPLTTANTFVMLTPIANGSNYRIPIIDSMTSSNIVIALVDSVTNTSSDGTLTSSGNLTDATSKHTPQNTAKFRYAVFYLPNV